MLIILFGIGQSCKQTSSKDDHVVHTESLSKDESKKKTQALILTQDFEYNPEDKNKIIGDYKAQNKITIPDNLASQNKWIMFEGPTLENDLVAYRYYADSRHRFDIYGKTVSNLVMDTVSWKYHDIMNWGSDILKVGNSLGLGSPAIWYRDSLYTLSDCDVKTIEVVDNNDKVSTIRTTFKNLKIADKSFDLIQDWSIEAGQPWCEIKLQVPNGELPEGMSYATGIVSIYQKSSMERLILTSLLLTGVYNLFTTRIWVWPSLPLKGTSQSM